MDARITPLQNAVDSLNRMVADLEADAADALHLKGALAWGWHAVGLLAYLRLLPERESFDAWVQDYLHSAEPGLAVEVDAHWEERQRFSFLELLDLLSDQELTILKPGFYQGWQDRTSRCRDLRARLSDLLGGSVGDEARRQLLLLLAAYHRLIRLPAEVTLDTGAIGQAFPALLDLVELLIDGSDSQTESGLALVARSRTALTGSLDCSVE